MNDYLPYDPGVLPYAPCPSVGESVSFCVEGLPPYKDEHFSIRNIRHKFFRRFKTLRQAAIEAMSGHAPYRGAIGLDLVMHAQELEKKKSLTDYVGGIMDTLDGSHGCDFTYLPIVYQDDCQVCNSSSCFQPDTNTFYEIIIRFLPETMSGDQENK